MNTNNGWNVDPLKELKWGNITPNGVVFADELAGSHGADFLLVYDSTQSDADLEEAANWLQGNRDVVSIWKQKMKPADEKKVLAFKEKQLQDISPEEKIRLLREIVAKKSFGWVGTSQVDTFSASAIVQVYDALNEEHKKKFAAYSIETMARIAFGLMG
jgi:hypothetical protein